MRRRKKREKIFLRIALCITLVLFVLNTVIWLVFHGIPLTGLPGDKDVESVTLIYNGAEEKDVTDYGNVKLLAEAAHLLNYRPWGEKEGDAVIVAVYHLRDGEDVRVEANSTTVWWNDKAHALKETNVFVDVVEKVFFDPAEN